MTVLWLFPSQKQKKTRKSKAHSGNKKTKDLTSGSILVYLKKYKQIKNEHNNLKQNRKKSTQCTHKCKQNARWNPQKEI